MSEGDEIYASTVRFAITAAVATTKQNFLANVEAEASKILGRPVRTSEVRTYFLEAGADLAISLAGTPRSRSHSANPTFRIDRDLNLELIHVRLHQLEMAQMAQQRNWEERIDGRDNTASSGVSASVPVVKSSGLSVHQHAVPRTDVEATDKCGQKVSSTLASISSAPSLTGMASPASAFGASFIQPWTERSSRRNFLEQAPTGSQGLTESGGKGGSIDHVTRSIPAIQQLRQSAPFSQGASSNLFRNSGFSFGKATGGFGRQYSPISNPGPVCSSAVPNRPPTLLPVSAEPTPSAPPLSPAPSTTNPDMNKRLATVNERYAKMDYPYGHHFKVCISTALSNGFYIVPVDMSVTNQIKAELTNWLASAQDYLWEPSDEELVTGYPVVYTGKGGIQRAAVIKKSGDRTKIICVDTGVFHHARKRELRPIAAQLVQKFPAQALRSSLDVPDYFKDAEWPERVQKALQSAQISQNPYTCMFFFYYQDENSEDWAMVDLKGERGTLKDVFFLSIAQ